MEENKKYAEIMKYYAEKIKRLDNPLTEEEKKLIEQLGKKLLSRQKPKRVKRRKEIRKNNMKEDKENIGKEPGE